MFDVGAQLRRLRKRKNLTLDQLAATSGIDRGTISRIELGHVSPRIDTISYLCDAMGTTLSHFFAMSAVGGSGLADLGSPEGSEGFPETAAKGTPWSSDFPLPVKADTDGYWPVPSSFWHGLLEVLERFEVLVRNSQELITVLDRAGTILYASPPSESLLGFRSSELVGRPIQTLVHPDDLHAFEALVARMEQDLTDAGLLEYRLRHRDDTYRSFSSRFNNQLNNASIRGVVVNGMLTREDAAGPGLSN
jgi:PAS domain S-box-containing protein